jgi:membrane protein required for colicin V production
MNALDIVLLAFLVLGMVRGFWRGLFVEVASLIALVAGVYGAFHFSGFTAEFLREKVEWSENTINIAAFFGTLLLVVLAISLAGKALTKIADFAALGLFNKLFGAFFGGLKVAVVLSAVLFVFEKMHRPIPFTTEEDKADSQLYQPIKSIIPLIYPSLIVNGKPIGEDAETTKIPEE